MRIVQVYKDYYPPTVGGIEQTVQRIAVELVRRGDHATVLTSHPGHRNTIRETVQGVEVIRCGEWARKWSTPFCPDTPRELARLDADLFHLHYPSPPGEVSWLSVRPRAPMVVTWHGDIIRQKAVLPIYGHVVRAILKSADAVMQTYERQADVSPFLGDFRSKCTVVPLGIELGPFERRPEHQAYADHLRRKHGTPLILFVGRLVGYKGLDVLLRAMTKVQGRLLIVGGGREQMRLQSMIETLGISDRATLVGRVEPSQVVHYLAAADVGVLPSIGSQETFGLSMVEMMAHGLPVVCTEVNTGTSYVNQDGETGFVVRPGDPQLLADALNRLLGDEALRARMGRAANERAHRMFTTEAMMRRLLEVYESVLARRRAA